MAKSTGYYPTPSAGKLPRHGHRRISDTEALTSRPVDGNVRHEICTTKISNGYLIERSQMNSATGEYSCTRTFSATPPKIVAPRVEGLKDGMEPNSMELAVRVAGGNEKN